MSATPRIFLVFDGAWLEVDASVAQRRGGLRAFAREAESKWDLQPNSYEFHNASAKVDSLLSLQGALEAATSSGVCKLEISERPEGKMMRTMRKEMQALEDRVMAKIEAMVTDVRKDSAWNNARLSGSIAPMVQCLATEQIELRNKISHLSAESQEAPPAVEEIETVDHSLRAVEDLEREMEQELALQTACDLDMATEIELADEVCNVRTYSEQAERAAPTKMPLRPEQRDTKDAKQSFGNPDAWLPWQASPPSIHYSSKAGKTFEAKWSPVDKWSRVQLGDGAAVPFAQSIIVPQLHSTKLTFGHRSCPLLPPLH